MWMWSGWREWIVKKVLSILHLIFFYLTASAKAPSTSYLRCPWDCWRHICFKLYSTHLKKEELISLTWEEGCSLKQNPLIIALRDVATTACFLASFWLSQNRQEKQFFFSVSRWKIFFRTRNLRWKIRSCQWVQLDLFVALFDLLIWS